MNAPQPYFVDHIWLIPMFPLLTAATMLFYGRRLQKKIIDALCVGSVGISFLYSVGAFFQLLAKPEGSGSRPRFSSNGFLLDPTTAGRPDREFRG